MSGLKFINATNCEGRTVLINTDKIVYAELVEDYYRLHMMSGEVIDLDAEPENVEMYLLMR